MKKLLATLISAVLLLSLAGCMAPPVAETTDGPYEGNGYTFTPPSGWTIASQDGNLTFLPAEYPTDLNNILVSVQDRDPEFSSNNQEYFETLYATVFENLEFLSYEETEIDGCDAFVISYSFVLNEIAMVQYQYIIDGPESAITFTFTQVNGDMSEIIESAMSSLTLNRA